MREPKSSCSQQLCTRLPPTRSLPSASSPGLPSIFLSHILQCSSGFSTLFYFAAPKVDAAIMSALTVAKSGTFTQSQTATIMPSPISFLCHGILSCQYSAVAAHVPGVKSMLGSRIDVICLNHLSGFLLSHSVCHSVTLSVCHSVCRFREFILIFCPLLFHSFIHLQSKSLGNVEAHLSKVIELQGRQSRNL